MATNAVLKFNSNPAEGTKVNVYDSYTGINIQEEFYPLRSTAGESEIISESVIGTAYRYSVNIYVDYNVTSLYTITHDALTNEVTILANNPNSVFSIVSNTTAGAVTTTISNVTPPTVFSISSITISEATTSPCDNVKLTITCNEQADSISSPVSQVVGANPFVIDVPRQNKITVSMVKDGVTVTSYVNVPKLLSSFFNVNLLQTPSNATATVNNTFVYTPAFTLEYSLDNSTWQSSKSFNALAEDDYTVYVRDNIGCSTSLNFSVDSFTPNLLDYEGICEISNLNPIRYKENVTWTSSILKTPENTLSFEENIELPNKSFTQPFTTEDIIPTQIKTNYNTLSAKIIDDSGTETALTITKKTNNMNITDVRDAVVLGTTHNGLNYVSLKYSGGNTYDPITLLDNGDYNIGTSVPDFMNKGDYANIQGVGWYKVLDVVYSNDAYVLILNLLVGDFPLTLGTYKITSVYNSVDFERYEFNCDFTALSGYYKVQVDVSDSSFGSKSYLSEWLYIKDSHPRTHLIRYYNSENNEINFNTGFIGTIRVPYIESMKWKPNTEQDIYVTDTNTIPIENKYRGFWDFTVRPLPTKMAEKLAMILLQDRLFINTESYLTEGEIESNPIGGQYQIKANLVKSDYVFNIYGGLGAGELVFEGTPLAIDPNGGFLLVE
ncbi:hypothetical protein [Tenacibaculum sp.]|uniref:hypothetical protein n=1 Tax=Tenacibaculum sp. TaxID=1906242 RepID=UPI003D10FAF4